MQPLVAVPTNRTTFYHPPRSACLGKVQMAGWVKLNLCYKGHNLRFLLVLICILTGMAEHAVC